MILHKQRGEIMMTRLGKMLYEDGAQTKEENNIPDKF